jgi:1-acyl-sn-glycerol-3-phosphate acyltransferase
MTAGDDAPVASEFDPVRPNLVWKCCRGICRLVMTLYFDLKVYGSSHVPLTGGVLLLSNHQSYLDPVAFGAFLRRPMSYLGRDSLFRNRFFGRLIRLLRAIPVRRGHADVGAMKQTIRLLRDGHMMNVYPEGTRTEDGQIGSIKPGAALVARRAGVPIVPVVIDGAFQAWPHDRKLPLPGKLRVEFGPAMSVAGLDDRQIIDLIDGTLRRMLSQLRAREGK